MSSLNQVLLLGNRVPHSGNMDPLSINRVPNSRIRALMRESGSPIRETVPLYMRETGTPIRDTGSLSLIGKPNPPFETQGPHSRNRFAHSGNGIPNSRNRVPLSSIPLFSGDVLSSKKTILAIWSFLEYALEISVVNAVSVNAGCLLQ